MSAFHLPRPFRLRCSPPSEFAAKILGKTLLSQPINQASEGLGQAFGQPRRQYFHSSAPSSAPSSTPSFTPSFTPSSAATRQTEFGKRRRTASVPFLKPQGRWRGRLSSADPVDPSFQGTYYIDDYRLQNLTAGQQIEIRLSSRQFDPYLQLVNARTKQPILYASDLGSNNTNARLVFTVQPQTQYLVRASSDQRRQTGQYLLKSRVLKPIASDFNLFYGYGLVDAAAAVNRVAGQNLFKKAALANIPVLGGNQWGLELVKAPQVWTQGFTGQGVTVAVLDEGIDLSHPDLIQNLWRNSDEIPGNGIDDDGNGFIDDLHGWNFVDQNPNLNDTEGHGTQVAGIIAAANDGVGITGVAYNAKIMPVKVIRGETPLAEFDVNVAAGIDYAANNGAQVINISLGSSASDPPLPKVESALQRARQAGVVVVFSAGNDRQLLSALEPDRPALYAAAGLGLAVGGIDSKRNFYIDANPAGQKRLNYVVAPAVDVYSTSLGGSYDLLEGTSFAAPFVAGVAALLLSAKPDLTPTEIEAAITSTASQQVQLTL